jgi:hypothetical protein
VGIMFVNPTDGPMAHRGPYVIRRPQSTTVGWCARFARRDRSWAGKADAELLGGKWPRRRTSSSATPALTGPGPNGSPGNWKPRATRSSSKHGTHSMSRLGLRDPACDHQGRAGSDGPVDHLPRIGPRRGRGAGLLRQGPPRGTRAAARPSQRGRTTWAPHDRIYVDLVGGDTASAQSTSLVAARRALSDPTNAADFPSAQQSQVCATEVPRFPGELPAM